MRDRPVSITHTEHDGFLSTGRLFVVHMPDRRNRSRNHAGELSPPATDIMSVPFGHIARVHSCPGENLLLLRENVDMVKCQSLPAGNSSRRRGVERGEQTCTEFTRGGSTSRSEGCWRGQLGEHKKLIDTPFTTFVQTFFCVERRGHALFHGVGE